MTQIQKQNVPKLRFPGFEGLWENKPLESNFPKIRNGFVGTATPFYEEHGITYLQGRNIKNGVLDTVDTVTVSKAFHSKQKKSKIKPFDILMVQSGHVGECAFVPESIGEANCHALVVMTPSSEAHSPFFVYYFYAEAGKRHIYKITTGNTIQHILTSDLKPLLVSVPTLPEQRKIAGFIGAVDKKIAQLSRKKALLENYKKGCMQQLFSQKIRFQDNDGNDFPDWEEKPLNAFLIETKKKSDGTEPVFSVSVHKGLIDQIEHLGRSFSAADTGHYNRVDPGDVVYTKSPTGDFPFGIIKQSKLDHSVIVSPLYGVFQPETPWLGYWLNVYFESHVNVGNYLKPIIQKGAKNTINITNTTFLSARLRVPVNPAEQRKIADFLSALDRKIDLVAQELTHARSFKAGLLQQMFV